MIIVIFILICLIFALIYDSRQNGKIQNPRKISPRIIEGDLPENIIRRNGKYYNVNTGKELIMHNVDFLKWIEGLDDGEENV